ncbi:ester cyclase [Pseudonocardia spinosispora]|uniref:ester cyclase n=1 Tax=Pseudonocardia spinosispora TaxID=103441 RepID=UPI000A046D5B|nr:ester cyclase [Pseudonocardia spinosispora]
MVRRNTEEVQGGGDWALFDALFADDFVDHTPQPGSGSDKAAVLGLYQNLRSAFPDFTPDIRWQTLSGDLVTTFKIYRGTHRGPFLGIAPTGLSFEIETVDVMRVVDGRITEHWGVANLLKMLTQLGVVSLG